MRYFCTAMLLIAAFSLTPPAAAGADNAPIHPLPARITDQRIRVDYHTLASIQQRIAILNAKGIPVDSYFLSKAQYWLDFATEEYNENDRTNIVLCAYNEAVAIVRQLEIGADHMSMATNLVGCTRLRPDLWQLAELAKTNPHFSDVAGLVAELEVKLVDAGHEYDELGWRHARGSIAEAESLAEEIQFRLAASPPPSVLVLSPAPLLVLPVPVPMPVLSPALPVVEKPAPVEVKPVPPVEEKPLVVEVKPTPPSVVIPAPAPPVVASPPVVMPPPVVRPPAVVRPAPSIKAPPVLPSVLRLALPENIHFAYNKWTVHPKSIPFLLQVVDAMRKYPTMRIHLVGLTDTRGSAVYNQQLGLKRAAAIRDFLVAKGMSAQRITLESQGKTHPVNAGSTKQAHATNRVVTITYTIPHVTVIRIANDSDLQADY